MATVVKRSLNVGVVGLGRMGVPIAQNLALKSRNAIYLQLHSRSLSKAKEVAHVLQMDGAQCAMRLHSHYATMTKWCDVIFTVLQDAHASRYTLLEAPDALVRNCRPGQIIVDHTTVSPEQSRECEACCQQRGSHFLDAPLSGSPQSAANGQLTVMVGGEEETFLKILPLLRLYGETTCRMGDCGSGSAAKLICQMLVGAHTIAAAEAMKTAHELGVENYAKLVEVLDSTWGSSTMLRRNASAMQDIARNPEKRPPTSSATVNWLLNDLSHIVDTNAENPSGSLRLPLFDHTYKVLERTSRAGAGDCDIAGVFHFIESSDAPLSSLDEAAAEPPVQNAPAVGDGTRGADEDPVEFY